MKTVRTMCYIALLVFLCSCGPAKEPTPAPEVTGGFEVSELEVGKADATILRTEQHCVVIDCGERGDGKEVLQSLAEKGVSKVDYLFVTHFDKDHVGGAAKVLDNIEVEKIVTPAYEGTNNEYARYLKALEKHNISPTELTENMSFVLDDVLFEVYPPMKSYYAEGDNDYSLAISVTHGSNRFLFAGDAEEERLSEIMEQIDGAYDFLSVPHHGRFSKHSKLLFEKIRPKISVITSSDKNLEEKETVAALESIGSSVYLTREGSVRVLSDGENLTVNR